MRKPALIIGILLLIAGVAVSMGLFSFQSTKAVAEIGPLEIKATETKKPSLNVGYLLLGLGAVVVVVGAVAKK